MSKLTISWTVVAAGAFLGSAFLFLVVPVISFTGGQKGTSAQVITAGLLLFSTLPASLLAIFKRLWAGVWLTVVSLAALLAAAWSARSLLNNQDLLGAALLAVLVAGLGLFFWITAALQWPPLRER